MARPSESEGVVSVGIMDKFKNFIGIPEDEYYDDEDVDFISSDNGRGDMREDPPSHSEKRGNKVVNIHATTQLQVVLVKPERFEDASAVADHLNDKRPRRAGAQKSNRNLICKIPQVNCITLF